MRLNKEELDSLYIQAIEKYLNSNKVYNYTTIAECFTPINRNVDKALAYAKENLPLDLYYRFQKKAYPFEAINPTEKGEVEELKRKVLDMALRFKDRTANLIDVKEELGMGMNKFNYLVYQLTYKYKVMNVSTCACVREYCYKVDNYDISTNNSARIEKLTDKEYQAIEDLLRKNDLPMNHITLTEGYRYLVNHGVINIKKSSR